MTVEAGVHALGGLGVFLFSLRFLTATLNQSLASRFRPVLERLLGGPLRGILFGLSATVLVQASSITILAAMGLVDSALISLEQAWFMMLGAAVGTTLKAWFFTGALHLGPTLIGVGSLLLLVVRRPMAREVISVAVAIGFAFLGLDMLADHLDGLTQMPWFQALMEGSTAQTLTAQVSCALVGCAMAVLVQSSSAVVILVLVLASDGQITFPAGAALILGMNVGTASTALLAGMQAGPDGRRLALGHFLAKAVGVLITLLLLPTFVAAVGSLAGLFGQAGNVPVMLAAVHTAFNVVNALFWWLLAAPALTLLRRLVPSREEAAGLGLAPRVRRMLASAPEKALAEAGRQFQRLEVLVKTLYDHTFESFFQGSHSPNVRGQRAWLERNLESLKETLHDLCFGLARHRKASAEAPLLRTMEMAELYSTLARTCLALNDHLERGFVVELYEVPDELRTPFRGMKALLDDLWLAVLFPDRPAPESGDAPDMSLEDRLLAYARSHPEADGRYLTWLFETAGHLRVLGRLLGELQQLKHAS